MKLHAVVQHADAALHATMNNVGVRHTAWLDVMAARARLRDLQDEVSDFSKYALIGGAAMDVVRRHHEPVRRLPRPRLPRGFQTKC